MSKRNIILSLTIGLLFLAQLSLQETLQTKCIKEFKDLFPTATEVHLLESLSSDEMVALVNKKNTSSLSIRKMEHGFLHRKIDFPVAIKALFDLPEIPKEMVVVDVKNTIHLVNYYYGVLWSSFSHPIAKNIISVSEIPVGGSETRKEILVGYTYDNDNKFGLDVVDMENFVILNSLKNLTAFKSVSSLKEASKTEAVRVSNSSVDIINFMSGELVKTIHNSSIDELVEIVDESNSTQIVFFTNKAVKAVNSSDYTEKVVETNEKILHINRYWNITNWVVVTTESNKLVIVDWINKKVKRDYDLGSYKMNSVRAVYAGEEESPMFVVPVSEDIVKLDLACFEENKDPEYDDFGVNLAIGVGLGLPLLSFLIVFAFIAYNRRLDEKENYVDANEMNTDTKV